MLAVLLTGCEEQTGPAHSGEENPSRQESQHSTKETEYEESTPPHSPETEPTVSLELNTGELSMLVGEESTLLCTVRDDGGTALSVEWTSENPAVAGVENGCVRALSPGETVITASAGGKTVTCAVTVSRPPLTGLKMSAESLQLKVGESVKIICTPLPEEAALSALTWSTSNAAAVSCSGGIVSALGAGTAEITATTREGIRVSCQVTVKSDIIAARSVTISRQAMTMEVGETGSLYAEIQPAGTTNKTLHWESADPTVAMVDESGGITAVGPGKTEITVTTANGKRAECSVEVLIRESIALSAREVSLIVGESQQIYAEIQPDSAPITWHSADESVAVCTDGMIRAVGAGQTEVTAVLPGGTQAACRVTVKTSDHPQAQIRLDVEYLTLRVGDVYTFTAEVTPIPYPVGWSTGNREVVHILDQKGSISAAAPGETMVTASVSDECYAVCVVKVVTEEPDREYLYSVTHAGAVITAYLGKEYDLIIPETIDDYPVVGIGENAFYNSSVTSVVLPNTLTGIEEYAFAECVFLQQVILSENLREIGDYAFMNSGLKRIVLPVSLRKVGICAFGGCIYLENIVVTEGSGSFTAENGLLYNLEKTVLYCVPAGWEGELSLADGVREIAPYALYHCGKVTAVRMEGVEILGSGAFAACTGLTSVELPDGLREIPDAFVGCAQLQEVTIPDSVESIAENAFAGCGEDLVLYCCETAYAAGYAAEKGLTAVHTGE